MQYATNASLAGDVIAVPSEAMALPAEFSLIRSPRQVVLAFSSINTALWDVTTFQEHRAVPAGGQILGSLSVDIPAVAAASRRGGAAGGRWAPDRVSSVVRQEHSRVYFNDRPPIRPAHPPLVGERPANFLRGLLEDLDRERMVLLALGMAQVGVKPPQPEVAMGDTHCGRVGEELLAGGREENPPAVGQPRVVVWMVLPALHPIGCRPESLRYGRRSFRGGRKAGKLLHHEGLFFVGQLRHFVALRSP